MVKRQRTGLPGIRAREALPGHSTLRGTPSAASGRAAMELPPRSRISAPILPHSDRALTRNSPAGRITGLVTIVPPSKPANRLHQPSQGSVARPIAENLGPVIDQMRQTYKRCYHWGLFCAMGVDESVLDLALQQGNAAGVP